MKRNNNAKYVHFTDDVMEWVYFVVEMNIIVIIDDIN